MFFRCLAATAAVLSLSTAAAGQESAAQSAPVAVQPVASASPQTTSAGKIIMYRGSSVFGAGVACPIRYKGQEVVELARGKFATWTVPSGRYILNNHTSSIEVAVDPGETRYVRCMIKMGALAGRADLQIVDEQSFNEHRNEYQEKPMEAAAAGLIPASVPSN